jgi:DNA polymerase-3 subunit epsilon
MESPRAFFETTFPNTPPKAWACSMSDIHWKDEDISSFKLEYIAYIDITSFMKDIEP